MSNQTILTNLEVLLAAVKAQPEDNFNLSQYRAEEKCGTLFCTAGLAGTLPHFHEQGLRWETVNYDHWEPELELRIGDYHLGGGSSANAEEAKLFGTDAWRRLFSTYGAGQYDGQLGALDAQCNNVFTHKELAIKRLELAIAELKGIAQ